MYTMRKEVLERLYINPRVGSRKTVENVTEEPIERTKKVAAETINNTKGKSYDFN